MIKCISKLGYDNLRTFIIILKKKKKMKKIKSVYANVMLGRMLLMIFDM